MPALGAILGDLRAYLKWVLLPQLGGYVAKVGVIIVFLAAYSIPVTFGSVMSAVLGSNQLANLLSLTPGGIERQPGVQRLALESYIDSTTATAILDLPAARDDRFNVGFAVVLMCPPLAGAAARRLVKSSYSDAKVKTAEMKASRKGGQGPAAAATTTRRRRSPPRVGAGLDGGTSGRLPGRLVALRGERDERRPLRASTRPLHPQDDVPRRAGESLVQHESPYRDLRPGSPHRRHGRRELPAPSDLLDDERGDARERHRVRLPVGEDGPIPSCRVSTVGFARLADSPKSTPANPYVAALRERAAPTEEHQDDGEPAEENEQDSPVGGGRVVDTAGGIGGKIVNIASPATMTAAPRISVRPTCWLVRK